MSMRNWLLYRHPVFWATRIHLNVASVVVLHALVLFIVLGGRDSWFVREASPEIATFGLLLSTLFIMMMIAGQLRDNYEPHMRHALAHVSRARAASALMLAVFCLSLTITPAFIAGARQKVDYAVLRHDIALLQAGDPHFVGRLIPDLPKVEAPTAEQMALLIAKYDPETRNSLVAWRNLVTLTRSGRSQSLLDDLLLPWWALGAMSAVVAAGILGGLPLGTEGFYAFAPFLGIIVLALKELPIIGPAVNALKSSIVPQAWGVMFLCVYACTALFLLRLKFCPVLKARYLLAYNLVVLMTPLVGAMVLLAIGAPMQPAASLAVGAALYVLAVPKFKSIFEVIYYPPPGSNAGLLTLMLSRRG